MAERANQRIAYHNGRYLPEVEVRIPYRDRSFLYGDGCFDMTRTFNGKPFKVKEHIERFYRSLAYLRIDIGMSAANMTEVTHEVLRRNRHLLQAGDDYWLGQRVSRGVAAVGDEGWESTGPQVIVDCRPLPFKERARHYRDGIKVIVPSVRRTPPYALSPRTKTHNYLNMVMADQEVHAQDPEAWAVLLDENGELRISVEERDLDLYDAYTADEVFLTSTSLCLCGVSRVNGAKIGDGKIPGFITKRLLDAYSELVSCDIADQYLRRLG